MLSAQQRTKIFVDRFAKSRIDVKNNVSYLRSPVFRQDNAILTCDSAVFYEKQNLFEAYNNVHINQSDTVNIYSDRLTYDGNTKMAHLTSNVRMLDQESVLTTNILDYNMASKIGTYVEGGKIVNKDVTLTSKNGYYFSSSRDAYFRYDVVVVTPQTVIKSDTMRYNTLTNWTYFYGPTNIKGKDDNLYTENGAYNTKTEYAYFGKKNLYTQGSKSLKGDSLYYDGKAGYGKAVRNITFIDKEDKTLMRGQLGYYYKKDERTLVTKNAYFGLGTSDSILVKGVKQPDSLWLGADTLETQMVLRKTLTLIPTPIILKDNEVGSAKENTPAAVPKSTSVPANKPTANSAAKPSDKKKRGKEDLALKKADSLMSDGSALKKSLDSIPIKKDSVLAKKDSILLAKIKPKLAAVDLDSVKKQIVSQAAPKKAGSLVTNKKLKDVNPLDTVRARSIKAYHSVNVFKSNMQAKADSLFYTSADSTLRWYYNPILWSEGTQQTGDTIYLQMKNKKLNTIQVIEKAFTVNVYKDSVKFNQIKGKKITGFLKDGKLNTMYVDGNSESVYFTKDDDGKAYKEMNQTVSSRIKIRFKNGEIDDVVPIKDVDGAITPFQDVKGEVVLTGFVWKPELRPTSKLQIINPKPKAKPKATRAKTGTNKTPVAGAKSVEVKSIPLKDVKITTKQMIDSAIKVAPALLKKADSLINSPAPLKK